MTSLSNFILISDALIEFNADICGETLSSSTVHSLEVHKEELRNLWLRVRPVYESSMSEVSRSDENAKVDIETLKARYQTAYQTYVSSISRICEQIELKRAISTASSAPVVQNSDIGLHSNVHLPPCDIEAFSGDYSSWPSFRDLFTALYVRNARLSSVEKLFHLNNKTRGEALEIVRKAPLTNEGFDVAWGALRARFENKRLLINTQLRILFSLENASVESSDSIKRLRSAINGVISALRLYDVDISSWDPVFVYHCSTRLSETTLSLWEHSLQDKREIPSWNELDSFLTSRFQTLETVSDFNRSLPSASSNDKPKNQAKSNIPKRVGSYQNSLAPPVCKLCPDERHTIRLCPRFISMNYSDRLSCIKKYKLCLNCFSKAHGVRDCKSAYNCGECQRRHNTLLHRDVPEPVQNAPPAEDPTVGDNTLQVQSCAATRINMVLLGTVVVNIVYNDEIFPARALIDSGSEASFISEKLFNQLRLPSKFASTKIFGLNGTTSAQSKRMCSLTIGSRFDAEVVIEATAIVIPHLTSALPTFGVERGIFSSLPDLRLADPEFYKTSHIDMLLGADLIPFIMLGGVRRNVCDSLIAQETVFGWILTGPVKLSPISSFNARVSFFNGASLDRQISRFWEVEDLPRHREMSPDDFICEENYKNTTRRDSSGRYIVSLPFREGFPHSLGLGHSRKLAVAQFLRSEKRLLGTPDVKAQYDAVVNEYLELGHMREVCQDPELGYYLPHHAVFRPESSSTKIRVVFNASSPTSNGRSLNDVLLSGPSLQLDLTLLLLQWRFFRYVFNCDIEKMYRQILVDNEHTRFHRIVFRDSPLNAIREYELKTVTFGVNCAPYLAIRTLLQLAEDVGEIYPIASHILRTCMYVDDVLAGAHDIEEAMEAQRQLIGALESAKFSLRKWTSNSATFLRNIPKEHLLNGDFLQLEDRSTAKTLGVRWNAKSDSFYFSVERLSIPSHPTKRQVLSEISKLFDPAGWLCPFIVLAKLLMRDIWVSGIDWDDKLSPSLLAKWQDFSNNYPSIEQIVIPRWIDYSPEFDVQIHGFSDASEKAYAAVVYIRVESPSGVVTTHLLTAKSRVSPLKTLSIPRLELFGGPILSIAENSESETNLSILNRWRRVKAISQQFSTRWKHEYLKELHKRQKWQNPQKNIDVGALVVIRDEALAPTEWRLGRVSKIYKGKDGLVRVADVITQRGTITRPLVKLVLLP
ncbi:uncharacterized protein LOC131998438 [Stomoxys calcitrans]|uniref:uncharacterized protein LOC131996098 n=2 Tax=Stomoxys calcitrans TaxID=35570 RepID=UPI0027E38B64|nr:uncharacterized protein LOC131996098 [Stomoxys calcitrans]XP_059226710.1 uncharacterized protein LOC131998438 [Stomoxys calcitrans]